MFLSKYKSWEYASQSWRNFWVSRIALLICDVFWDLFLIGVGAASIFLFFFP